MFSSRKIKKIILVSLVLALLVAGLSFGSKPKSAQAVLGVLDINFLDMSTVVQIVSDIVIDAARSAVGAAIDSAVDSFLDDLESQIIDWINGESGGGIVINWRDHLRNAASRGVGAFAESAGFEFLCSPFSVQVQLALVAPKPNLREQTGCTLEDIENFYQDFRSGGWIAYQTMWEPQNNYYGSVMVHWFEKSKQETDEREAAQNEALAGRGFLSAKNAQNSITIPGPTFEEGTNQVLFGIPIGKSLASRAEGRIQSIVHAAMARLTETALEGIMGMSSSPPSPDPAQYMTPAAQAALANAQTARNQQNRNYVATLAPQIDLIIDQREIAGDSLEEAKGKLIGTIVLLEERETCGFTDSSDATPTETLLTNAQNDLATVLSLEQTNQDEISQLSQAQQTLQQSSDSAATSETLNDFSQLMNSPVLGNANNFKASSQETFNLVRDENNAAGCFGFNHERIVEIANDPSAYFAELEEATSAGTATTTAGTAGTTTPTVETSPPTSPFGPGF